MITTLALLPLLIFLIIVIGSGFIGLVFIALFNIGLTSGLYFANSIAPAPSVLEQNND